MLLNDILLELLQQIQLNQSILIGSTFGDSFLTEYEKELLIRNGVDLSLLYTEENDPIFNTFTLGLLAQGVQDNTFLGKLDLKSLRQYIKGGRYIPLTQIERGAIESIKLQALSTIRTQNGKIFEDITNTLTPLQNQELLRDTMREGIANNQTYRQIANELGHKTGDWGRNFDRMVEYHLNTAYQYGRASMFKKQDPDPIVYKKVFNSACSHCTKLYLTKGFGSEPRLFKLSTLESNGDNIGRKVADWKAVVGSTHPHCRCLLMLKPKNRGWDNDKQTYSTILNTTEKKIERPPIKVSIGGKQFVV